MKTVAVLDACILYSASLRDLFMNLTEHEVFQPKWTETIHDEWTRNVLANRPDLTPTQIKRTRQLMNANADDWQCTGYEAIIPTLTLPDPEMTAMFSRRRLRAGRLLSSRSTLPIFRQTSCQRMESSPSIPTLSLWSC